MKQKKKEITKIRKLNIALGSFIKTERKKKSLRQTKTAKLMGLDQSAMSRVESGKQPIQAAQLLMFCRKLKITKKILGVR